MKQYLGKTVLFTIGLAAYDGRVLYGTVDELSPSGKYVRMNWEWYAVDKLTVLEVLPDEDSKTQASSQSVPAAATPASPAPAAPTEVTSSVATVQTSAPAAEPSAVAGPAAGI